MQSCTKQNSEERESVERQSELEPVTKQEVLFIVHENAHLPCTERESGQLRVSTASPVVQSGPT